MTPEEMVRFSSRFGHRSLRSLTPHHGGEHDLGSDSLGDLLKAALLVELEAFTGTLGLIERHAVVEVGCGFQLFPRLLLQLLAELLSFDSANVRYRDADGHRCEKPSSREQERRLKRGQRTFQRGHAVCQLYFFARGIYSSPLVIQNERRWLGHLFGFHFPIKNT